MILIDKSLDIVYTSLLFYTQYPPSEFQKKAIWHPDVGSGFRTVKSFGKYYFTDIKWAAEKKNPQSLLVMPPKFNTSEEKPVRIYTEPTLPVVLSLNGVIVSSPFTEVLYRAYQSEDFFKKQ